MPSDAFDSALPFVLQWEGGFVDDRDDPGGRTNKGITQRVYDDWRARSGLPAADVKGITDNEVKRIYESGYWVPPRCDEVPGSLPLLLFDTAVNMGVGRAVRMLQKAADCKVDGGFGPGTLAAVQACNVREIAVRFCGTRRDFYLALARKPPLDKFLKGWLGRLNALQLRAGLPADPASATRAVPGSLKVQRIPDFGVDPLYDQAFLGTN